MHAKPIMRVKTTEHGVRKIRVITPEQLFPKIKSKESLLATLEWFSHPFLKNRTPNDKGARRRHVEESRPALRWFCKKFNVPVPEWLKGNRHYDSMSDEEHNDYFGPGPLKVREFEEIPQAKGA